jgi:hypothetical protein
LLGWNAKIWAGRNGLPILTTYIVLSLLTSFEIDCFMVCEHKDMNIRLPNYRAGGATELLFYSSNTIRKHELSKDFFPFHLTVHGKYSVSSKIWVFIQKYNVNCNSIIDRSSIQRICNYEEATSGKFLLIVRNSSLWWQSWIGGRSWGHNFSS